MDSSDEDAENPNAPEADPAPPVLSYRTPGLGLKTIARMPAPEAGMARSKLGAEGIEAFIAGEDVSAIHPLAFRTVELQVPLVDFERAREILNRPPEDDEFGEYADERWRCPKCHRKEIDILPLSRGYRQLRWVGLMVLVIPVGLFIVLNSGNETMATQELKRVLGVVSPVWLLALIIIAGVVLFSPRRKRCRVCGHEWEDGDERD